MACAEQCGKMTRKFRHGQQYLFQQAINLTEIFDVVSYTLEQCLELAGQLSVSKMFMKSRVSCSDLFFLLIFGTLSLSNR